MKTWFIPGNVPSSKNSRQWTGKYFVASKSVQQWRRDTKPYWIKFKDEFLEELEGLEQPYYISFEFIRKTKHKFDYLNPAQTIQDEMVAYDWLEDDHCDIMVPVFEKYSYDKEKPGVIISIIKE